MTRESRACRSLAEPREANLSCHVKQGGSLVFLLPARPGATSSDALVTRRLLLVPGATSSDALVTSRLLLLTVGPGATSSDALVTTSCLLLIAMPGATSRGGHVSSNFLLLIGAPGATSSDALATTNPGWGGWSWAVRGRDITGNRGIR